MAQPQPQQRKRISKRTTTTKKTKTRRRCLLSSMLSLFNKTSLFLILLFASLQPQQLFLLPKVVVVNSFLVVPIYYFDNHSLLFRNVKQTFTQQQGGGVKRGRQIQQQQSFLQFDKLQTQRTPFTTSIRMTNNNNDNDEIYNGIDSYKFWDESPLTPTSFNMDLENILQETFFLSSSSSSSKEEMNEENEENEEYKSTCVQRAQDALEIMEEMYHAQQSQSSQSLQPQSKYYIQPNTACYTTVIQGWYSAKLYESPYRCQYLLQKLCSLYHESNKEKEELKPNFLTFMLVCQAWAEHVPHFSSSSSSSRLSLFKKSALYQTSFPSSKKEQEEEVNYHCKSAQKAQDVLEQMMEYNIQPDVHIYGTVINAWALRASASTSHGKVDDDDVEYVLNRAEKILESMEQEYDAYIQQQRQEEEEEKKDSSSSSSLKEKSPILLQPTQPNVVCYTAVINGYANANTNTNNHFHHQSTKQRNEKKKKKMNSIKRAEYWFQRMKLRNIQPDVMAYTSLMNVYAKCNVNDNDDEEEEKNVGEKAVELLHELEDLYLQTCSSSKKDTSSSSSSSSSVVAVQLKPNPITYATCINAISNSQAPDSAFMVESILRHVHDVYTNRTIPGVVPTTFLYNAVIEALARCECLDKRGAVRAEELLYEMLEYDYEDEYSFSSSSSFEENQDYSYGDEDEDGGSTGDDSYNEEEEEDIDGNGAYGETNNARFIIKPDVRTYAGVMLAWSRREQDKHQAAVQAQRILDTLEKSYSLGETDVMPNVVCYTICMKAWADCAASLSSSLSLSSSSYESRRGGSITAGNAATAAEHLLKRMEEMYEKTGDARMRPTATSYTTVVAAHGRSKEKHSAQNAENVVKRMERYYYLDSDDGYSGRAKPNRIVYNALIDAWSKSNEVGSALRAEETLMKMERLYQDDMKNGNRNDDVRPDVVSYNAVLNAWARFATTGATGDISAEDKIAAAQRAQQILEHMEGLHETTTTTNEDDDDDDGWDSKEVEEKNNGDTAVKPDAISYNTVIKAWARSGHPSAAIFAQQILHRMEELYSKTGDDSIRPNFVSYTTTINAAAYSGGTIEERQKAYQVAIDAFRTLCESKYDRPSHVTYGTMFRAIANLSSFLDVDTIKSIWRRCKEEGQVSDFVLSQLRSATTPDLFAQLLSDGYKDGFSSSSSKITDSRGVMKQNGRHHYHQQKGKRVVAANDLPSEWRANVRGQRRR